MNVPFGAASDSAEEWIESWATSVTERAAKAQSMAEQVSQVSASATSSDGAVEVTVAGSGAMTGLRLGEQTRKWSADQTAAEILAVMRRAQAKLASKVAEIAADTVGADSEAGKAVVASFEKRFPEPPSDDPDGDGHDSPSDWRGRASRR
jgi:DNA-binding protein YbaB